MEAPGRTYDALLAPLLALALAKGEAAAAAAQGGGPCGVESQVSNKNNNAGGVGADEAD